MFNPINKTCIFTILLTHAISIQAIVPFKPTRTASSKTIFETPDWRSIRRNAQETIKFRNYDLEAWCGLLAALISEAKFDVADEMIQIIPSVSCRYFGKEHEIKPDTFELYHYLRGIISISNNDIEESKKHMKLLMPEIAKIFDEYVLSKHLPLSKADIEQALYVIYAPNTAEKYFNQEPFKDNSCKPSVKYPDIARIKRIQGTVIVEVTIKKDGTPIKAEALDGPEELRAAAEEDMMQCPFPIVYSFGLQQLKFQRSIPFKLK